MALDGALTATSCMRTTDTDRHPEQVSNGSSLVLALPWDAGSADADVFSFAVAADIEASVARALDFVAGGTVVEVGATTVADNTRPCLGDLHWRWTGGGHVRHSSILT